MVTDNPDSNEWNPRFQRRENVTLPPWVNESLPAFSDLLSAHDVARLTRRSRWALSGLMLLGLFPKRRRYQGRPIGWNHPRHNANTLTQRTLVASLRNLHVDLVYNE